MTNFDRLLRSAFDAGVDSVRPDQDDPSTSFDIQLAWAEFRDQIRTQPGEQR